MSNRRALVARCCCRTCAPGADTYKTLRAKLGARHRRPRNSGPSTRPRLRQRLRHKRLTPYRSPSPSASAHSGGQLPPIGNQTNSQARLRCAQRRSAIHWASSAQLTYARLISDDLLSTTRCFPISRLSQPSTENGPGPPKHSARRLVK
jgi:hypothetical protein